MSQYSFQPAPIAQPTNGLGIAGFICSLVGLLSGGILSPIGLILSLVALGRQPRGFAVAGTILGLLGTCAGLLVVFVFGAIILAALGIGALAVLMSLGGPQRLEIFADMFQTVAAIREYEEQYDQLPADLNELGLKDELFIDPWGNRYEYHFVDDSPLGFDLSSCGPDGVSGTQDDVALSSFDLKIEEGDDGGRVRFTLGNFDINIQGEDEDGTIVIRQGNREVLRIEGDGEEGGVVIKQSPDDAATPIEAGGPQAPPTGDSTDE